MNIKLWRIRNYELESSIKAAIPNMAYTRIIKHFSIGIIQKYTLNL